MIDEIINDAEVRMGKSVESLGQDLTKIRTGRAHPSLLDHITVDYYGSQVPVKQVANIAVEDSRTLTVTPWEKNLVRAIEKAIISRTQPGHCRYGHADSTAATDRGTPA